MALLREHAAEGPRVTLICATRGEAGIKDLLPEEAGLVREGGLRAPAAALGIAEDR